MKELLRNIFTRIPLLGDIRQIRNELRKLNSGLHALQTTAAVALKEWQLHGDLRYRDAKRLLQYEAQVCSQGGEDGIIREIFRRIGTTSRTFAEVGVGDGNENNSAFLLSQGWNGYWIDGDDKFLRNLATRTDISDECLRRIAILVTKENIGSIFSQLGIPADFDFLSLDIDQNTYHIWEALQAFTPRVVVVEYNSAIPADVDWKVNYSPNRVWDGSQNFGASLKAFENLGRRLGYSLVGCEIGGSNAFFVRDDLVSDHFASPFSAENHYESPRFSLHHRWGHRPSILDRASDV